MATRKTATTPKATTSTKPATTSTKPATTRKKSVATKQASIAASLLNTEEDAATVKDDTEITDVVSDNQESDSSLITSELPEQKLTIIEKLTSLGMSCMVDADDPANNTVAGSISTNSDGMVEAVFGRESPWHQAYNDCTVFKDSGVPPEEAKKVVFNWNIHRQPLLTLPEDELVYYLTNGLPVPLEKLMLINDQALVRNDTQALLSIQRSTYEEIQPLEMWDMIAPLLDPKHGLEISSAVNIDGGQIVCLSLTNNQVDEISPSWHNKFYLNLINGNAGKSWSLGQNSFRIECKNMAQHAYQQSSIKLSHRIGVKDEVDLVLQALDKQLVIQRQLLVEYKQFVNFQFTEEHVRQYLVEFCGMVNDPDKSIQEIFDSSKSKIKTLAESVYDLYQYCPDICDTELSGTAAGMFNATTTYYSHISGRGGSGVEDLSRRDMSPFQLRMLASDTREAYLTRCRKRWVANVAPTAQQQYTNKAHHLIKQMVGIA